jgi:hypothetical protein
MVVSAQMTRLVCCNHVTGLYQNNEIQKTDVSGFVEKRICSYHIYYYVIHH